MYVLVNVREYVLNHAEKPALVDVENPVLSLAESLVVKPLVELRAPHVGRLAKVIVVINLVLLLVVQLVLVVKLVVK